MIEALITVVAHVGLVSLLMDPLLRGTAIGQGFPRLRLGEHWILQVGFVMAREGRGVIETLIAMSAGVGLSSSMDLLVLLQMTFADKTLPAHVTLVGLVARMDPLVLSERGSSCKTFSTLCALVRFFPQHNCSV